MGFHISPSASQDTHSENWGTVTAARTAVWGDSVSYDDLMAGFKANRVYASEDDELVGAFQVEYSGSKHWMGETVDLSADEDDVDVLVKIWQAQGSDGDSVSEGPYTVNVFRDPDGVGGQRASILMTVEGIQCEMVRTIPLSVEAGQYIYVEVTEENGQDNPLGDGDDETNNDTGAAGADGKRDNMNDSAWTSPIWCFGLSSLSGPRSTTIRIVGR